MHAIRKIRRLAARKSLPVEMLTAACPYNDTSSGLCTASLSGMSTDRKDSGVCSTENHDDCPIFLSKILRLLSLGEEDGDRQ
jgi:hypothetical protein